MFLQRTVTAETRDNMRSLTGGRYQEQKLVEAPKIFPQFLSFTLPSYFKFILEIVFENFFYLPHQYLRLYAHLL
jgi:hypothetical protein